MKIYSDLGSGKCLEVKYTAGQLGLSYAWVPIDLRQGETRTSAFVGKFPMAQIPAVEFDDGRRLAQSNGIVRYLAHGSRLLPADPFVQAKIDELLFWEQYSHEPYVATSRYHMVYLGRSKAERDAWRVERGEKALDLMQALIKGRTWFVGDSLSVADIALLAYTRLAREGGFGLSTRPNVRLWIKRAEEALGLPPAEVH